MYSYQCYKMNNSKKIKRDYRPLLSRRSANRVWSYHRRLQSNKSPLTLEEFLILYYYVKPNEHYCNWAINGAARFGLSGIGLELLENPLVCQRVGRVAILRASKGGYPRLVEALFALVTAEDRKKCLQQLCIGDHFEMFKRYFVHPDIINHRYLRLACHHSPRILKFLLADPEIDVGLPYRCVFLCGMTDNIECCKVLLADPRSDDCVAGRHNHHSQLYMAVSNDKMERLKLLLDDPRIVVRHSSVFAAAAKNKCKMLKMLIANDPDSNHANGDGRYYLRPCTLGYVEVVRILLDNNYKTHTRSLRIACENHRTEVVRLLLQHPGPHIRRLDYCKTLADNNGDTEISSLLAAHITSHETT